MRLGPVLLRGGYELLLGPARRPSAITDNLPDHRVSILGVTGCDLIAAPMPSSRVQCPEGAAPWQRGTASGQSVGMAELRRLREHDIPVLGQLAVLYPEQVIERGWLPVQQALALGEDELPVGYDAVDPVHHCLPYAGLDRLAKPADPVGDLRIVLNEPVIAEEAADLRPICVRSPPIMISSAKLATISLLAAVLPGEAISVGPSIIVCPETV
jgi:hypothetical protein